MLDAIVGFFTASGLVAKLAIAILIVELAVFAWRGRAARKWALMIPNAFSGLAMLGALLVAMNKGNPVWILVCLSLGFLAHLTDLWLRLGRK